jgi:hypothetical protein
LRLFNPILNRLSDVVAPRVMTVPAAAAANPVCGLRIGCLRRRTQRRRIEQPETTVADTAVSTRENRESFAARRFSAGVRNNFEFVANCSSRGYIVLVAVLVEKFDFKGNRCKPCTNVRFNTDFIMLMIG